MTGSSEKSREELLSEIEELRRRVSELETAEEERKRAKAELQNQLQFFQKLIDTIPSPIFYKDTRGRYLGCNRAFEERVGLKRGDIVGKTSFDIFPERLAESYHNMDMEILMHPGQQFYESTLLYSDGLERDVIINKATFTDAEGRVAGLVGVTIDISARKQAEEALRKAHDELEMRVAERTAELARANVDLRSEIAERKRVEEALRVSSEKLKLFAYSVAHDLKSPAVGVYGLTKLLYRHSQDALDEKSKNYCEQILRTSEHIAALVEKINMYASTKEVPLRLETVDVKEVLRIVREEFSSRMTVRQIQWSEPGQPISLRADRMALLRVFRNLVDNALKYGGDRLSLIAIDYRETEDSHVFSVSDNGVGIKEKDTRKLFELFHRQESAWGVEGTGLGLAIVKEIAEQHRGAVCVDPGPQGGMTFYITISKSL